MGEIMRTSRTECASAKPASTTISSPPKTPGVRPRASAGSRRRTKAPAQPSSVCQPTAAISASSGNEAIM